MADFYDPPSSVSTNPWDTLRRFTNARIALVLLCHKNNDIRLHYRR